ncbi:MAG: hypothetical protein OXG53_10490 [Chloroflexi bacterium]|nr:hypothetical protein [Chloroflexota bacterium]
MTNWDTNPSNSATSWIRPANSTSKGRNPKNPTSGQNRPTKQFNHQDHARRTWIVALIVALVGIGMLFVDFLPFVTQEIAWLLVVLILVVAIKY